MDVRSVKLTVLLQRQATLRAERERWEALDEVVIARLREERKRFVAEYQRTGVFPTREELMRDDDDLTAQQCRIGAAYHRIDTELASIERQLVAFTESAAKA